MQGLLVFKVLVYWTYGFLMIGLILVVWSIYCDQPRTMAHLLASAGNIVGPALVASLFLLPLIVMDCIRWSNRYAGPMVRLYAALTDLAEGQDVEHLDFRQGDLWSEMAEQFNQVAAELRRRRADAADMHVEPETAHF